MNVALPGWFGFSGVNGLRWVWFVALAAAFRLVFWVGVLWLLVFVAGVVWLIVLNIR